MWRIVEHRRLQQKLTTSVPAEVVKRYVKWKEIARLLGPKGVQAIPGNHDEALSGKWAGYRSSRLGRKWRVIYQAFPDVLMILVVEVNAHDYKKH
ncbi:type II toxin-antitoxin system mRNA interferase toxin, RelE/StbE family [Rugamonas sp. A1-17]|nr:type II toxin-antitoxin system mRNA interferase toxin, RelE/StbE family [Rugamonas sp. A1-17]